MHARHIGMIYSYYLWCWFSYRPDWYCVWSNGCKCSVSLYSHSQLYSVHMKVVASNQSISRQWNTSQSMCSCCIFCLEKHAPHKNGAFAVNGPDARTTLPNSERYMMIKKKKWEGVNVRMIVDHGSIRSATHFHFKSCSPSLFPVHPEMEKPASIGSSVICWIISRSTKEQSNRFFLP